jgi:hypothetical protein
MFRGVIGMTQHTDMNEMINIRDGPTTSYYPLLSLNYTPRTIKDTRRTPPRG